MDSEREGHLKESWFAQYTTQRIALLMRGDSQTNTRAEVHQLCVAEELVPIIGAQIKDTGLRASRYIQSVLHLRSWYLSREMTA